MSSQGTTREVDPTQLVRTVLDKTKGGKLTWEETADENIFIASVGGNTTLEIRQGPNPMSEANDTLSLLDENGKLLWVTSDPQDLIWELFGLARKIALRVDEKVEAFLDTLQKL
jgi:hypothetical protein